eukprot:4743032-Alexandrium_andersonii.AAC.1
MDEGTANETLSLAIKLADVLHLDPSQIAQDAKQAHQKAAQDDIDPEEGDMDDEPPESGSAYYFAVTQCLQALMGALQEAKDRGRERIPARSDQRPDKRARRDGREATPRRSRSRGD